MKYESEQDPGTAGLYGCEQARFHASAWLDGELADERMLSTHLQRCEPCRAQVEELRATQALFAPARAGSPVADLWPLVRARLQAQSAVPPARVPWSRIAAVLLGFAGMATLLQAASQSAVDRQPAPARAATPWSLVLHAQHTSVRAMDSAPEQRLLAALERTPEEQR